MTALPASTLLVTGGAGFIGSRFVVSTLAAWPEARIVDVDQLTYAGHLENLAEVEGDARHVFVHGDIAAPGLVAALLAQHRPSAIVHFAAESHVDRSIDAPGGFVHTNVVGTFALLEAARAHAAGDPDFRFLQVSTDEVYGSTEEAPFSERSPFAPSSPYAASKAAADHFVSAYFKTYGLPTVTTRSSNNYGPYQYPEKLIPLMVLRALDGEPLPVYGDGRQVRDWIHVDDHCAALRAALERGRPGESYNLGARNEQTNLDVIHAICDVLDELVGEPRAGGARHRSHRDLVAFVADRPGHDRRYAIDPTRAERELGWSPRTSFGAGLRDTVAWYLQHRAWCARAGSDEARRRRGAIGAPDARDEPQGAR